jgi:T5SS/PEP-CTERM-associated repeat protein
MARTFTWIGTSAASGTIAADWSPSGGPPASGDTEIIGLNGTVLEGDGLLNGNTVILDGGRMTFAGDTLVTYASPSLNPTTLMTTATAPNTVSASTIDALGNFVNQGTILAAGAGGSTLTINVGTTVINGLAAPGYYFDPGTIEANAGNTVTINIGATSELFNTGTIIANGGSIEIDASPSAIASGYAPVLGLAEIQAGGTLETNAAFSDVVTNGTTAIAATGVSATYDFTDATAGNMLRIDNPNSFGGRILNFQAGDTIELVASLPVATVIYSGATGILTLENSAGGVLAGLNIGDGAFQSGTFAVAGGSADGFRFVNQLDGNTDILTTTTIPVWNGSSGIWQNGSSWSGVHVPATLDTPLIGQGATAPFVLTTGTSPVMVGGFELDNQNALLRVITNTTATPSPIGDLAGTLEVTDGTTLTTDVLRLFTNQATVNVDAGGTVNILGRQNMSLAAISGTLAVEQGNTVGVVVGAGQMVIDGSLLAGPSLGGNGGSILIGEDSGGLPAGVTVNAGGKVTDTFALLGSDPTSAGSLILDGSGANWTDLIDTGDTLDSRGDMTVGFNNVSTNTPIGFASPPAAQAAQLLVENGATLTDQRGGFIGEGEDSDGNATVATGGFWNMAVNGVGQLGVGDQGAGTLSVLNGGSVAVGNVGTFLANGTNFTGGGIGLGVSAGASGAITVSGTGSQLSSLNGISVGRGGQGSLTILNGGSVAINLGGVNIGTTAGAASSGTITIGGTGSAAVLSLGSAAAGIGIGESSQGTVNVLAGGTITLDGTRGIGIGQAAGASGLLNVSGGVVSEGPTTTGIAVGEAAGASATLQVMGAGTVTVGAGKFAVGVSAGATGVATVSGGASVVRTTGTSAVVVGSSGTGELTVTSGGSIADNNGLFIGTFAGGSGTIAVNAATVTAASMTIDSAASQAASGLLTIGAGGAVDLRTGNAVLNKNAYATLSGGVLSVPATGALDVFAGAELDGFGQVANPGGLDNAGTIVASGGALELTSGSGAMGIAPGATLVLDFGFSGAASFDGGTGLLSLGAPATNTGTIDGFGAGDTIALGGIVNVSSVILGAGNVLTIDEAGGGGLSLQLDPTQSFVGATFSSAVSGAATDITVSGVVASSTVANAYAAILRTPASPTQISQTVSQIASGQTTLTQFESGLIASEQAVFTTLPALVTIDAFYDASPSASTLTAVAASTGSPSQIGGFYSAEYLHGLGYSDPNVWTIMASQWGADQSSAFFQLYNNFGTNYGPFISAVYEREFGFAPSAGNLATLVNDVPGVQALLAGGGGAATPIQVVSGIYGYLLYVGQTTPTLPTQYVASANAFVQAAANGTANYGQELTQQFPATTTAGALSAMADPNIITVTSSDQLIDPGAGSFSIQFQVGATGDSLMLHNGGVDQVSGFDPSTDSLDVRGLLAGTGLALTGDVASLSGFLNVADQGGDALIRFDPTGQGGGSTVAVLQGLGAQGLGASVTGLDSLIAKGAVRMT